MPGLYILVAPGWIDSVDWAKRVIRVELTRKQIDGSPEYDPSNPINREYEDRLYEFYGR